MPGIAAASAEEVLKSSMKAAKRTPNDFIVPGIKTLTRVDPNNTNQPHPPSGGTSFHLSIFFSFSSAMMATPVPDE